MTYGCLKQGALDVLISDTEERDESIWKARGAFLEAIKGSTTYMDEVDVVVPRDCIGNLVDHIRQVQMQVGIRIKLFGHAGDGNLHIYILKDELTDEVWKQKMEDAMDRIYQKANELRGEVSGEHGIGYAKKEYLASSKDETVMRCMNHIKTVFDPNHILNPHKICM